uniref:Replication protein A 70 kDa DNA-binding subunit B n=1 Tax=Tanacetum cinerariifolium TaxID=118510 RepID=A0A699IPN6_TANCI|nr:replication protein A 70 kDa DNA-binding subunit B [Tanacetum cinerariifolium]
MQTQESVQSSIYASVNPIPQGSLDILPSNLETYQNVHSISKSSTIDKGKSMADIPIFKMTDEESKDEYGCTDRIEGISKEYYNHVDQTKQCIKCGALLWLAESMVGSTNATNDGFSLCSGRRKIKLPVALKNAPIVANGTLKRRTSKRKSFMKDIVHG